MKTRVLPTWSCLCFMVALSGLLSPIPAGGADKPTQRKIYDEYANGDKQVADAIVIAKREQKHILLQFGANWCGWCLKLHKLFESDKTIHEELNRNYVLVMVDVNQDHNKDLSAKYGGDKHGIPFLVVLDVDGKMLTTKDTGDLEEGDHHSPQKVAAFLKAWGLGAVGNSVPFAPNPKVTLIRCEDLNDGLKLAYFEAENSSESEILCRVQVDQGPGSETKSFLIPSRGYAPFSFRFRTGDAPKITAEVLGPVSRFLVPLPNQSGAANRSQPVSSETNRTPSAAGSGR